MSYIVDLTELIERVKSELRQELLEELHTQTATGSEWLSFHDAVAYLGVTPGRLRKLVASRSVPFHQEGKGCRVAFSRRELDRHMGSFSTDPIDERSHA